MKRSSEQLWRALADAGLVENELPVVEVQAAPWFVKALSAISGWLAAILIVAFIATTLTVASKNPIFLCFGGVGLILVAIKTLKTPDGVFFEHLGLALSLAGQVLFFWGLSELIDQNAASFYGIIAFVQLLLVAIIPNFEHRVLSSFIAISSLSISVSLIGVPYFHVGIVMALSAWCWINEFRFPKYIQAIQAVAYGLTLFVLAEKSFSIFGMVLSELLTKKHQAGLWYRPWMDDVMVGAAFMWIIWVMLDRAGVLASKQRSGAILLGGLAICLVSLEAQGVTVGLAVMILGFWGSNRVLIGVGILSLLTYVSCYYYLLEATLLHKAATLLTMGFILLVSRWFFLRNTERAEEGKNA